MSCEKLTGLLELDDRRGRAVVAAGTILSDFKDELATHGFLYPPDPTSERECSIAGTVACDASGARTYRYGATNRWVRGVEVALPDGSVRWFRSRAVEKDAAGFAGLRDFVQLLCGSEGTLGFITRVEVQLIPLPEAFSAGLAFFLDLASALDFVGSARREDQSGEGVRPRCLELLDRGSLEIMAAQKSGVAIPEGAGAAIFFEEEHEGGAEMSVLERWWTLVSSSSGALIDDTVVATERAQQEELRSLRHAVPASLNEEGGRLAGSGGKKISTDWAVPFVHLAPLMRQVDGWLGDAGITRFVRYGHVGNGHPHYNLIVADAAEARIAAQVVDRMCAEACGLGGTVTAEHGVGKEKIPYLHHRYGALELAAMRGVKAAFDPCGIMAPGNLFG
jgi:FAD/FMN-containing dehydrogenase